MKIENVSSSSFKAKYINNINICKKDIFPNYLSKEASFVQIEPKKLSDLDALENAVKYWDYDKFGRNICFIANAIRNESKYYKNHKVYALTTQKENFNKLDSDLILGLIGVCPETNNYTFIEYMQVNPEMLYPREPEYKGIGTAILESLKKLSDKIYCYPSQTKSVIDFYIKNGFKKTPELINHYVWEKQA